MRCLLLFATQNRKPLTKRLRETGIGLEGWRPVGSDFRLARRSVRRIFRIQTEQRALLAEDYLRCRVSRNPEMLRS